MLRAWPKSARQSAAPTNLGQGDIKDVLALLSAMEYVRESDGTFSASIPVLTERDRPMLRERRVLGRQAMVTWMDERHEQLSTDLVDLTPRRYGLTLSHSF